MAQKAQTQGCKIFLIKRPLSKIQYLLFGKIFLKFPYNEHICISKTLSGVRCICFLFLLKLEFAGGVKR